MRLSQLLPEDCERGLLKKYAKQMDIPYTTLQSWRDADRLGDTKYTALMKRGKIIKIEKRKTLWESEEYSNDRAR